MIFNHSLRIVKKLNTGNLSGLRLSKLSAQCHAQRCIIYSSSRDIYEEVLKSIEEFGAGSVKSKKIGKSLEITGTDYTNFFGVLAYLNFADDKILDMIDGINSYVLSGKLSKEAHGQGLAADMTHVEKVKDTIVLYMNVRNEKDDYVPSEDEIFKLFDEFSEKYGLGIVYDGMEEIA